MLHCPQHIGTKILRLAVVPPYEKLEYHTVSVDEYPLASRYVNFAQIDDCYAFKYYYHRMIVCTACGLGRRPQSYEDRMDAMKRIEEQARAIRDIFARTLRPLPLPISREIMEYLFFVRYESAKKLKLDQYNFARAPNYHNWPILMPIAVIFAALKITRVQF
jgi:hypothetical protein